MISRFRTGQAGITDDTNLLLAFLMEDPNYF